MSRQSERMRPNHIVFPMLLEQSIAKATNIEPRNSDGESRSRQDHPAQAIRRRHRNETQMNGE